MPLPSPNPLSFNWQRIGSIAPKWGWQDTTLFADIVGTFRLSAFSMSQNYEGHCHYRIKYHLSTPIHSEWYRYYANSDPLLIHPYLDPEFKNTPKSLQIIDYRGKILYSKPEPRAWIVFIDLMVVT